MLPELKHSPGCQRKVIGNSMCVDNYRHEETRKTSVQFVLVL